MCHDSPAIIRSIPLRRLRSRGFRRWCRREGTGSSSWRRRRRRFAWYRLFRITLQRVLSRPQDYLPLRSSLFLSLSLGHNSNTWPNPSPTDTYLRQTSSPDCPEGSYQSHVPHNGRRLHREHPPSSPEGAGLLRGCLYLAATGSVSVLDEARRRRTIGNGTHL